MGREAYLARLALGISAFQEPSRDQNGDFVLGGQAHRFDDIGYHQQWNERGHAQNLDSERNAKRFYKSQNEILQACGLVVRKNAEKKRKRRGNDLSESAQLKIVEEENETGFILKYVDNLAGDLLTWWVCNLKKRLLIFRPPRPTMLDTIKAGLYSSTTMSFLFGGFGASTIDSLLATMRDANADDTKYVDFLETRTCDYSPSWQERIETWSKWACFMSIEIPLSMVATLQNLGFTIGPAIIAYLRRDKSNHGLLFSGTSKTAAINSLTALVCIYLIRGRIYDEIFWRSYVFLRQILPRPRNPSSLSIQAAADDEFGDSETITGIGRPLGLHTNRRFYGPQSFWPALQIAFPWVRYLARKQIDKDKIKKETLTRCAMMEDGQEFHDMQHSRVTSQRARAENIISNLESLGVDIEEDFFVDVDQWSRQIDGIDTERMFDDALHHDVGGHTTNQDRERHQIAGVFRPEHRSSHPRSSFEPISTEVMDNILSATGDRVSVGFRVALDEPEVVEQGWTHAPVEVLPFPTSPQNEALSTSQAPAAQLDNDLLSAAMEVEALYDGVTFDSEPARASPEIREPATDAANGDNVQHTPPGTAMEWEQPLTPEPGIRRATSLSHTQTTPRPIRRVTETGNDTSVDNYLAQVLAEGRRLGTKRKPRDDRETRITRLSVFASDSLAWHASVMITSLLLLPLNAVYYRRLATGFLSLTEGLGSTMSIFEKDELRLLDSLYSWDQVRMVLLSLSLECLIHGTVWQIGCGVARYYGRVYHWNRF